MGEDDGRGGWVEGRVGGGENGWGGEWVKWRKDELKRGELTHTYA